MQTINNITPEVLAGRGGVAPPDPTTAPIRGAADPPPDPPAQLLRVGVFAELCGKQKQQNKNHAHRSPKKGQPAALHFLLSLPGACF